VGKKPKVVFVRGFFIIYQIFSSKLAGNGWGCAQWGSAAPADLSPAKNFVASPIAPNI